jgi:hypothetical protein
MFDSVVNTTHNGTTVSTIPFSTSDFSPLLHSDQVWSEPVENCDDGKRLQLHCKRAHNVHGSVRWYRRGSRIMPFVPLSSPPSMLCNEPQRLKEGKEGGGFKGGREGKTLLPTTAARRQNKQMHNAIKRKRTNHQELTCAAAPTCHPFTSAISWGK